MRGRKISDTAPRLIDARSRVALRPERFLLLFAISLLVAFGLLLAPFVKPVVLQFSRALVSAAAFLIHVCGGHVRVEGAVLRPAAGGFGVEMRDGCNGVNVMHTGCYEIAIKHLLHTIIRIIKQR